MRFKLLYSAALVLAFIVTAARANDAMPADVTHHAGLSYGEPGQNALKLDIVTAAKSAAPSPAIVLIHGTGSFAKQRQSLLPQAIDFARQGYVAVTIDYRHTSDTPYPGAIEDGEAAIRWLRTHAAEYKIDPDRIAAVGYSGGGALAYLLGTQHAPEKVSSRVQAVAAYYPPTDFAQLHRDTATTKIPFPAGLFVASGLEQWLGGTPAKAAERYAQASPITYVGRQKAPILLVHGADDKVVPIDQSHRLVERTIASKGRISFLELTGAGHAFDDEPGLNTQLAKDVTRTFLNGILMPARLEVALKTN